MQTRRSFFKSTAATTAIAAGGLSMLAGCSTADVFAQIQAYVPVALSALDGILTLVGVTNPAIAAAVLLVKAAFADLSAAAEQYKAAPAADKATLLAKIKTILHDITDNFGAFLAAIPPGAGPNPGLIPGLVTIIVSTLAGLGNMLPGGVPVGASLRVGGKEIAIIPKARSVGDFKRDFNQAADAGGAPQIKLH